jgi:hypothetical protein
MGTYPDKYQEQRGRDQGKKRSREEREIKRDRER